MKPKNENNNLPAVQEKSLPAYPPEWDNFDGAGFEGTDKDSYTIPRLAMLQGLSPQVNRAQAEYIDGAQAGMILHTLTGELFEKITVCPCAFRREYLEWSPRNSGGSLRGIHAKNSKVVNATINADRRDDNGRLITESGNLLADTREHFVLLIRQDGGGFDKLFIPMSITLIRNSKDWMSLMMTRPKLASGKTPPSFAYLYTLEPRPMKNNKGSWFGWKATVNRRLGSAPGDMTIINEAIAFNKAITSGIIKLQHEDETSDGIEDAGGSFDGNESLDDI